MHIADDSLALSSVGVVVYRYNPPDGDIIRTGTTTLIALQVECYKYFLFVVYRVPAV